MASQARVEGLNPKRHGANISRRRNILREKIRGDIGRHGGQTSSHHGKQSYTFLVVEECSFGLQPANSMCLPRERTPHARTRDVSTRARVVLCLLYKARRTRRPLPVRV